MFAILGNLMHSVCCKKLKKAGRHDAAGTSDVKLRKTGILLASVCLAVISACSDGTDVAPNLGGIDVASDTIGGAVTGANGPEAGVWVIAETKDLPNRFVKIVVTDDKGRYLLPELRDAQYKVWVRGYGLVDSTPVDAKPGARLDLTAVPAPNEKAAAEYYPASYWYSLLRVPAKSEFTSASKNKGIPEEMVTDQHFTEQLKEKCLFCHQLGSKMTRQRAQPDNSVAAWDLRMQRWPSMHTESRKLGDRGLQMLSEWAAGIAAGDTPKEKPKRPSGVERNVVVTLIGWGDGVRLHDQTSSDRIAPGVNAGGPIYGMNTAEGYLHIMDLKTLKTTTMPIPGVDGSEHEPRTAIHASEMDDKGRVWMVSVGTSTVPMPAWCYDGSTPSSKYFPLSGPLYKTAMPLPVYDPKTKKITTLGVCAGGNHGHFSFDADKKLFMSHDTNVIPWINTRIWDETKDLKKAFNWCPMVLDTSGDGKIDPDRKNWVQPPLDALAGVGEYQGGATAEQLERLAKLKPVPGKDLRLNRYLYGVAADPQGGFWAAAYVPYVPSGLVHFTPGDNPPATCKTEYYEPPMKDGEYLAFGARGAGSDSQGRGWAAFSSGHVGLFDPRKCKVTNGPTAVGQHCPEGWTLYDLPSPKLADSTATSDMGYSEWADYSDVMGLGKDTHFFPLVNSDAIVALPEGSSDFVTFRVPYPRGFYTRGLDFRVEKGDAADWKTRGMYATHSSAVLAHMEGGMEAPGVAEFIFQMRPNPLAH